MFDANDHDIPPPLRSGDPAVSDSPRQRDSLPDGFPFELRDWVVKSASFWTFRTLVTPTIIRVVFVIGLLVLPIVAIGVALEGTGPWDNRDGRVVVALICSLPILVFWRIACEAAVVLFGIHDRLGQIAEELKRRGIEKDKT